ncbi:hypothetical protein ACGF12_22635 [Kitasatospora sp. NPDC048296]|uniref:hypothetical protein n=1 Tax=Kitasatospora sp. NPDC048296 TaxID=3364048 RepID=UPI00371B935F
MPLAVLIDPDGSVETIALPDDRATRDRSIVTRLSGTPEPAYYHRRALMHIHGSGQNQRLADNLIATTACVWRGLDITSGGGYFLPGRVIITSPDGTSDLAQDLVEDVHAVAAAVRLLLSRGPAPWSEVLRAARGARDDAGHRGST